MDNKMKMEFYSKPENEAFARSAVSAFVAYIDPTIEELTEIKTAVSEAVSNAVIHGYPDNQEGKISLECHINSGRRVIIIVSDEGVGIENIERAKEPLFTTGKPDERSGMGFTVMESFMDKLEIDSIEGQGTRVTMLKNLDSGYEL
jgi:stage II sporulation protein AB (anti-sigma F factor)